MNYDPQEHDYVEHPTYTGSGCAICGKHGSEHNSVLVVREMTKAEAEKRYPTLRAGRC